MHHGHLMWLLLNNDTEVDKNFVGEMLAAIKRHKKASPAVQG